MPSGELFRIGNNSQKEEHPGFLVPYAHKEGMVHPHDEAILWRNSSKTYND